MIIQPSLDPAPRDNSYYHQVSDLNIGGRKRLRTVAYYVYYHSL